MKSWFALWGILCVFSPWALASVNELIPVQEQIVQLQDKLLRVPAKEMTRLEEGPALKKGSKGSRVVKLNTRLAELGYFKGVPGDAFEEETANAVLAFQTAAGLMADGVVDHQTRFNLNLSEQDKVEILRVQIQEMERFFNDNREGRYVLVNIPAYTLHAYEDGKKVLESRIVIGGAGRQTPLMKTHLTGIVFNPQWSPPKTILTKDIFKDGELSRKAVARMGLKLIDGQGKAVSMDEVSITKPGDLAEGGYRFMQPSGERNALGRLKFDLDNPHSIYMHDTNHRELFGRQSRALSSGCIRVDNFRELAAWVSGKSVAEIDQELLNRRTRRLDVERIPVYIVYWIASVNQGRLVFNRDVYGRVRLGRKAADASSSVKK